MNHGNQLVQPSLRFAELSSDLALLRARFDEFAAKSQLEREIEVTERAQQVSAAIQRLEWAIARQRPRSRAASSGN